VLEGTGCSVCGNTEQVRLFRGTDRVYRWVPEGVWCEVVRCCRCKLIYLSPRVEEGSIGLFYPESEYYAFRDPTGAPGRLARLKRDVFFAVARRYFGYSADGGRSCASAATVRAAAAVVCRLLRSRFHVIPPHVAGGRLLEFGFGAGDFLCRMQELGWECWGVELNAGTRARVSARGVKVFEAIDDPAIPEGYFDHVTSYHALEHVYDPKGVLRRMHDVLKPGGRIFCGVPNFDSLLGRVFGTFWDNLGVPIHPYVFTTTSLKMLLEACGFADVRIRYHSRAIAVTGSIQWAWNGVIWRLTRRKYVSTSLRDSRVLQAVVTPGVKVVDWLHLGDGIEATARKP